MRVLPTRTGYRFVVPRNAAPRVPVESIRHFPKKRPSVKEMDSPPKPAAGSAAPTDDEKNAAGSLGAGKEAGRAPARNGRRGLRVRGSLWSQLSGRCLAAMLALGIVYTLWAAQALIVPLVLALFLGIVLSAPLRFLRKLRLPDVLAAALVVGAFLAVIGTGVYFLSAPAAQWLDRAPQVIRTVERKIAPVAESLGGARQMTEEIEEMAEAGDRQPRVTVNETSLASEVFTRLRDFAAGAFVTVVLLFFLLATGRRTMVRVAHALTPENRPVYEGIVLSIQTDIAAYLQTITAINAALGLLTAALMWATGMPSPALWGAMAGLLNFMPYLGAAVTLTVISLVAAISFETLWAMALPPLGFLVLTSLEGHVLTPMIVGRRLTLNPLVVFVSVVAWGWLWGVPGALLAVPLVAVAKIVLDHTDRLPVLRAALE